MRAVSLEAATMRIINHLFNPSPPPPRQVPVTSGGYPWVVHVPKKSAEIQDLEYALNGTCEGGARAREGGETGEEGCAGERQEREEEKQRCHVARVVPLRRARM